MSNFSLVIHGGAGSHTIAEDRQYHDALKDVLQTAGGILENGGSALDAVVRAVVALEDCLLFNAGKGAVLALDGSIELDACVADGRTGKSGGVSNVRTIRNPVLAARAVMDHTPHTILCAAGAEDFAATIGLTMVENDYFQTEERRRALEEFMAQETSRKRYDAEKALGTVGAAAIDKNGDLAAATSTGGLTGKMPGRISDSSIPGAGTWAANGICALSCTGTGDVFIRNATARDVACLVEYKNMPFETAVAEGLKKIAGGGGAGGIIGVDAAGNVIMDFNTKGMYRGFIRQGGAPVTAIL